MRVSCRLLREQHKELVTSCAWTPSGDELLTSADDQTIKRVHGDDLTTETVVGDTDGFVTKMSWCPSLNEKQTSDTLAVCCSDGSFRILHGSTGREEKRVQSYNTGAAISIQWNLDGSALATGGEDGTVKIWSRVGMLRNTVATTGFPVYGLCWGRQDELLFSAGKMLTIEQRERKRMQWKAHDATVLAVDWNPVNNLIVSGGEDRRYRVWDAFGRQLFQSQPMEHVVTSISWSPNGSAFAVGSYDVLKICDKTGWTHAREDLRHAGSVLSLAWSQDGTMLGGACASRAVLVAQVANRSLEWKHFHVVLKDAKQIEVQNTLEDTTESIVFRDRVLDVSMEFGFLVVHCATPQVHIYALSNLGTPQIVDVPHTRSALLLQSSKTFLAAWTVFTYEGRRVCGPQALNGIVVQGLDRSTVALNDKVLAILENNRTSVRLVDTARQQAIGVIQHKLEIVQIALCKHETDMLAFVDRNGDLFVHCNGRKTFKLPVTMVQSIAVNDESDALVACTDGGNKMVVWYYPQIVWIDPDLLADTSTEEETPVLAAKQPQIVSFTETLVTVRTQNGSLVTSSVSRYPSLLHKLVAEERKWEDAIRLCRFVNQKFLWAILAGMAIKMTHLDTAEIALAATEHVAKLNFILYLKEVESEKVRMAELALYRRDLASAEQILLHANPPLLYRAIKMNARLFRWERAKELAARDPQLAKLVQLYEKRWTSQEALTDEETKELKAIKVQYSEKPQDDDDDDDDDEDQDEEGDKEDSDKVERARGREEDARGSSKKHSARQPHRDPGEQKAGDADDSADLEEEADEEDGREASATVMEAKS
ncbi:Intraflagellar transport protein 80-like [Hondaea fermentalgiana]|uniref:Intraflagellar transport protein 80-like n=1 Tax=Hondaea fermentalgiana TaxID=2315210 RepID=A0A2R5G1D3_9STRA|nr:Intraflagellar transport protein 80-like [Hondaea fermentalgiana]|eukprot:GBG24836.1 Intraflagellar transport protein 80-like [Hondaea fermentalgiana]